MTVTTTSPRVSYAGNGSTTLFTVPFLFPADADLRVVLRSAANVETLQVLTTNYTVAGAGNPAGGSITMGAAPATGETLVIRRVVALTQGIDYTPNDPFPAETHEAGLDRGMMAAQQLDEALDRALTVPESDTATTIELPIDTARASKFLGFDASGNPIAAAGTSANLGPVLAFIDTLLDDADAGTARTTLGLVIGADVPAQSAVDLQGKKAVWVPAAAMQPAVTTGCSALTIVETTAGRPDLQVRDFDTAADEHAMFSIQMPKSWNEGTVTYKAVWTHAGGQTAGLDGVAWFLQGLAVSDDESADQAYGTAVVATDDQVTAEDVFVTAESAAVTLAGTPASEDHAFFRVGRDVSDAADDLDIDARLIGIVLFITTNAGNDA